MGVLVAVLVILALDVVEPESAGRATIAALALVFLGGFITQLLGTTPAGRDPGALAFTAVTSVILIAGATYVAIGPTVGRFWAVVMLVAWFIASVAVFRLDAATITPGQSVGGLAGPLLRATGVVVAVVALFDLAASVATRLTSSSAAARAVARQARRMAYLDELTGIPNRRAAREALPEVIRSGGGSVVLIDLDHFKQVNDTYGHEEGDRILRAAAQMLGAGLRDEDLVARWGGEEFLLILPDTPPEGAAIVAERCRAALRTIEAPVSVTASFGIAPLTTLADVDLSLARADDALYDAKDAGRDRVVIRGAPETA